MKTSKTIFILGVSLICVLGLFGNLQTAIAAFQINCPSTAEVEKVVECTSSDGVGDITWISEGASIEKLKGTKVRFFWRAVGSYTINVTDSATPANSAMSIINITAPPPPAPPAFGCVPDKNPVKVGQEVTFKVVNEGNVPNKNFQYNWHGDNGSKQEDVFKSFKTTFNSPGTHSVEVTEIDPGPPLPPLLSLPPKDATCSVIVEASRDAVSCTIETPAEDHVLKLSPFSPIPGAQLSFRATGGGVTDPKQYVWSISGGTLAVNNSESVYADFNTAGNYTVTVSVDADIMKSAKCSFTIRPVDTTPTPTPTVSKSNAPPKIGTFTLTNPLGSNTIDEIIDKLLNGLITVSIPILTLLILYAGALILTSQGKPETITKGKDIILYALLGFGIIIVGKGFVSLIISILGI